MEQGLPLAHGNTADIYLAAGGVWKVFHPRLPAGAAEYEATKQRAAQACGLPVPRVLKVTQAYGRPAVVMEYIAGPTLWDVVQKDSKRAGRYVALSVEVQAEIHQKRAPGIERMADKLRRLGQLEFADRLCHGDFHLSNLIWSGERAFVIDWADASAGCPSADACRTHLLYSQFSAELAEIYLGLYCEKTGAGRGEVLGWAPIVAAARLAEGVPEEEAARLAVIARQGLG